MSRYDLLFILKPPAFFGLPEDGKTVVPAGAQDICSPAMDTTTGNIIGHGTLSKYRETPLSKQFVIGDINARIQDDHLTLGIEGSDEREVVERGRELADRLCVFLSVYNSNYFHNELLQAVDRTERRALPVRRRVTLLRLTPYDLTQAAQYFDAATSASSLQDESLEKAAAYLYHARFIGAEAERITDPFSFHAKLVTSEIILNCFKSISTIIGDPRVDGRKEYETRYKGYGFPDEMWKEANRLYEVRSRYDIAHYSPGWEPLEKAKESKQFSLTTAQKVIVAYIAWLQSNKPHEEPRMPDASG